MVLIEGQSLKQLRLRKFPLLSDLRRINDIAILYSLVHDHLLARFGLLTGAIVQRDDNFVACIGFFVLSSFLLERPDAATCDDVLFW